MKITKLFAVLSLIATVAIADTVYYPNGTYLQDGKFKFISSERPVWNEGGTNFVGLATTNDINAATGDVLPRVDALEETVGNSESGLVYQVTGLTNDVTTIKETVYDSTTGLVTKVETLTTTVGDENSGLVKDANDLKETVYDSTTGLVTRVETLESVVGDENDGLVKDVEDLQNNYTSNTVYSINGIKGDIILEEGQNISFETNGNTLVISGIVPPQNTIKTYTNAFNQAIDVRTYSEQFYTWDNPSGTFPSELTLAAPDTNTVGTLIVYLDQFFGEGEPKYTVSMSNVQNAPSMNVWTESYEGATHSVWKLEFETVPGSSKWHFKNANEYVIQ